jgi:hypothetical protein
LGRARVFRLRLRKRKKRRREVMVRRRMFLIGVKSVIAKSRS